MYNVSVVK